MFDRKNLNKIISSNDGKNWWKPELFRRVTLPLLPKELEIVLSPSGETQNYNCFIYLLGYQENKQILKDCKGFIYENFIKKLLELDILKKVDTPQEGGYIFYQDGETITHGGVVEKDGTVLSKWSWGPLIRHKNMGGPSFLRR